MPRLKTEPFGTGDQSWIGSTHGIYNCRTVKLDPTSFTGATHYPNGYLPSGTPLSIVDGTAVRFDGDAPLAGFLYTDQKVAGDETLNVPLYEHGKVRIGRLPQVHRAAVGEVAEAANPSGLITFVDRDNVAPAAAGGEEG